MHIAAVGDNIAESVALAAGLVPTPLLLSFWGVGIARSVSTGVRLGVFEALAAGEKTAAEVAAATACHPAGMETLLNALNGFGYLARRDGRYANTKVTRRWLLKSARWSLYDAMAMLVDLWDWMASLEESVKTGKTVNLHEAGKPPEFWERYMRGLAAFARIAAREVARKLPLDAPKRLLDVGGGHGLYSAAFCRKHAGLQAEVLDLPEAATHGRRIVEEAGFSDRVRYREGDLRTTEWGEGYDAVLIFNVLHNSTVEEAAEICRRAHRALRPGGTLAILDSEHRESRGNLNAAGGFNELFFFVVSGARAYPETTMRGWLEQSGFGALKTSRLLFAPAVLLTGRKAA